MEVIEQKKEQFDYLGALNDDCIFAILERLPLDDLCEIRSTCKKLRELADNHFQRKYPELVSSKLSIGTENYFQSIYFRGHKKYQKSFSHLIRYVHLQSDENEQLDVQSLQFMRRNCCRNVKRMHLSGLNWSKAFMDGIQEFTRNLETISIETLFERYFPNVGRGLDNILMHSQAELKTLSIKHENQFPTIVFPKLEIFQCDTYLDDNFFYPWQSSLKNVEELCLFLQRNVTIKRFMCTIFDYTLNSMKRILEEIIRSNIEELFLSFLNFDFAIDFALIRNELKMLDAQKNFKSLELSLVLKNSKNLQELASIESFKKLGAHTNHSPLSLQQLLDDHIPSINLFVNLTELRINGILKSFAESLSQKLVNLEELFHRDDCGIFYGNDDIQLVIEPFVRNCAKLVEVSISSFKTKEGLHTHISEWCAERIKLKSPKKVMIYLYSFRHTVKQISVQTELVCLKQFEGGFLGGNKNSLSFETID